MFTSLFHPATFVYQQVFMVVICSFVCGIILSLVYKMYNTTQGKYSLVLAIIPVVSSLIIMLINGNIGTSIAIAASFGLVRFRSAAGTASEIGHLFIALMIGLMSGMGFIVMSLVITAVISIGIVLLELSGITSHTNKDKRLKITIPENYNYANLFDDIFEKYTNNTDLVKVRTINMGTLYELTYKLQLKDYRIEKEFIDELRCRNGNLDIVLGMLDREKNEM